MTEKYSLLVGGLGDDAHSVGITLLALAFKEEGFLVNNIGIRNNIADFLEQARLFDLTMISNNNGHAELYLQDFGRLLSRYRLTNGAAKLWYLGGNLSVSSSARDTKRKFIEMGFTDVFPKPVSIDQIIHQVKSDLHKHNIHKKDIGNRREYTVVDNVCPNLDDVSDEKWSLERLHHERRVVLTEWKTGREVETEPDDYRKPLPEKSLDQVLSRAKQRNKEPLVQPRTGVADINEEIEILQRLESADIDVASAQLDAASRSKLYEKAKTGVQMSLQSGRSFLNGFPVPIYGVKGVRRIVNSINLPFQLRAGGPDHRFTYEIALKGGATGVEGGFLCYLLPYDKSTSPADSVKFWQYVDRLSFWYFEKYGVSINREYFGPLTANLIEPSLAIVVNIVQAILSAKQGVTSISLGYAEQGNRSQDIAAMLVLDDMGKKYLSKHKLPGRKVTTVFHQYMAAFPKDESKAERLIYDSAVTAAMAGATKMMSKTPVEASKIPSWQENARGVSIARQGLKAAGLQKPNWPLVSFERSLLEQEVTAIMGAIEELGNGSLARGAVRAIYDGYIDIPFSPHVSNKNEVVTLRDKCGAVRFAEFGKLPFSDRVKDFHRSRMDERKTLERDNRISSLLEKDLTRIWKNDFRTWPLDDDYVF